MQQDAQPAFCKFITEVIVILAPPPTARLWGFIVTDSGQKSELDKTMRYSGILKASASNLKVSLHLMFLPRSTTTYQEITVAHITLVALLAS